MKAFASGVFLTRLIAGGAWPSVSSFMNSLEVTPAAEILTPGSNNAPLHINGIFPSLTAKADASAKARSESGTGALMPWADKLYMVSYLSVVKGGSGSGFYVIDENFNMTLLHTHNSCYANRMIHRQSNQIVIGPYVVDSAGNWKVFEPLLNDRLGAMAEHIFDPENKVYLLSMDGPLYEANVHTLEVTKLSNLVSELQIPKDQGEQPHFKAMHAINGRLYAASNTFEKADFEGKAMHGQSFAGGGRLASWDGQNGSKWEILEHNAFVEVTGRRNFGVVTYAVGWDAQSAILKVLDPAVGKWQTFRLPKASHAYDHLWQTEWPRIREVETERYLMDAHGMFYELSPLGWGGATWGIRPISQHLRIVPDFTSFRGLLVLGGNQVSSIFDNNVITGQAQSGLWFGKTDDLWSFGKPKGWGGPWRHDMVKANVPSDPFLMTGFDKKTLHLRMDNSKGDVNLLIQIDFTGLAVGSVGEPWSNYSQFTLGTNKPYYAHVFPDGFSAHWVRIVADADCEATAYFHYS